MAKSSLRLPDNAPGDLYVDSSCIDCDTCRWMARATFDSNGSQSVVTRQPETEGEWAAAFRALVSCPTSSIGVERRHDVAAGAATLPLEVEPRVLHCGYHAESSFGAASYLLLRNDGNVLFDSPRFARPLVRRIEELGGVSLMVMSHKDDVADHAQWAAHFGCERVMHADDVNAGTAMVERQVSGTDPIALAGDLLYVPTPGHTEGSACLLFEERVLLSGDHVAWSDRLDRIIAFRRACWFDWDVQIESMRRTAELRFEAILPGHGRPCRFPYEEMARRMRECVAWMEEQR